LKYKSIFLKAGNYFKRHSSCNIYPKLNPYSGKKSKVPAKRAKNAEKKTKKCKVPERIAKSIF